MPLILAANDDVKNRYLTPLAAGESSFSYGLSEREAGSDTAAMTCRAVRDGDDWVLTGQKSWITNAGVSQYYTVLAVTDPEGQRGNNISAFVVEKSDEGFTLGAKERKLGIKGSPTRELIFDHTRIPGDRVVGEVGAGLKIALATLDHTRVTIGAQAVGIAQGALDHALSYVKERRQFGRSVGEFQGVQFMLADMAMEARPRGRWSTSPRPSPSAATPTCRSSVRPRSATPPTWPCGSRPMPLQLLGGAGYTRDFPLERMMRDAKITQIYEGTNQVQRMVMARQLSPAGRGSRHHRRRLRGHPRPHPDDGRPAQCRHHRPVPVPHPLSSRPHLRERGHRDRVVA